MAAVLVPPSACRTSQSTAMVFSPSARRSTQARSERPISREISWVRPPTRPFTDSRSLRSWVADGSIAYSAVSQPRPEPLRQRGTPVVTEAAHNTLVPPNSTSTDPAGCCWKPRVNRTGRSSSSALPSALFMSRRLVPASDRARQTGTLMPATELISGPRNRCPSRANGSGSPVARNSCGADGVVPGASRSSSVSRR